MEKGRKYSFIIISIFFTLISFLSNAQTPSASFNLNKSAGCAPLTVVFTNTSVNASSYYWDFGNGNISVLPNPANVYSNSGTYTVKLIAFSPNGEKDSIVSLNLIKVSLNSSSDFYTTNTSSCFVGNIFSYVNTSINSTTCLWDFGDGSTSTVQNPTHSYLSPGNYTVKLIAYNSFGCSNIKTRTNYISVIPKVHTSFTVNDSIACDINQVFNFSSSTPNANSWFWSFADGSNSILANPQHSYTNPGNYTVSLITGNANNCSDTLIKSNFISISANQVPLITASSTSGCTQFPIQFENSSSNATTWLWNFGDSTTSNQQSPTHIYQNSGNYNVTLTITNSENCVYTNTLNNFVSIDANAVSNFSLTNSSGCPPLNVHFTNLSTDDLSRIWEFGDGSISTVENPSHIYTTYGNYTVKLRSYNAAGCVSVYQFPNAVTLPKPTANFSANLSPSCAPLTASFVNSSINGVQWLWHFGDGSTSTLQNPAHTYLLPGDYDVSLIAYNTQGCSDTLTLNSYVHVINTVANYTAPPTQIGCVPLYTTFSNTISNAISWLWNFGDGTTSTLQNPSHTFLTRGFYTVSLTIQLNGGCTQVYPVFRTFDVQGGEAVFTFTQTQCAPYVVSFTDVSTTNWTSWLWDFGDGSTSTLQNPLHTYSTAGFNTITLTGTTSAGCSNSIIQSNVIQFLSCNPVGGGSGGGGGGGGGGGNSLPVSTGVHITYALTPLSGCVPFVVHFNNILHGTTSWLWNFGDGSTSNLENPIHTYITNGNYNVTMIASNPAGITDTITFSSYVHSSGITTNFSFTQNNTCLDAVLSFTTSSQNAISWLWNFGDGSNSSLPNPTHTFLGSLNNYAITLVTTNAEGCSGSMSHNMLNSIDNPIVWANNYLVCSNQPVNFNCSSSNFTAYLWDFNDGTTSTLQNPTHTYLIGGAFNVSLIVTGNNGCTYNFSLPNPITVENPIADFSFALANGCNSQTVNFTNLSLGISLPLASQCKWNFGDGSPVQYAGNTSHTYLNPGVYHVTLTANNDGSCINSVTKTVTISPSVVANFTSTQNAPCLPITVTYTNLSTTAVSWLWDFGDGTTSALENPVHTFFSDPTANVKLTITDITGCQATLSKPNISVFKINFVMSATTGCAPLNVTFADSSANTNNWLWNFGDGSTSTLQNPTHLYLNNGNFPINLIAKTIDGCVDTMLFNSIIVNKPTADFIAPNPTNCSPTLVMFSNLSVGATSWLWDFGDGSFSVNQNPGHIYNIPGLYTVGLIVKSSTGCSDTLIRVNYIKVPGSVANFSASANQACTQSVVQFNDSSFNATTYNWNFGDGNTSSLQSPSHVYNNSGQYSVSLIVFDSYGCTSDFTLANPININTLPTSNFAVSNSVICTPAPVSFINNSLNGSGYLWNFGDGTTSTLQSPTHIYSNSGIDTVTLITLNGTGCSDTSTFVSIVANATPVANYIANERTGCPPFTASFSPTAVNSSNSTYLWNFGNGITSTQQNPTITFSDPGFFTISLIVSNANGCSDTVINPSFIQVYDFNPPSESSILYATVTSDNSTSIKWNQCTAIDFAYYKIFRKDILTGNFISIGQVNTNTTVTFSDNNLNTLSNSYCYKVQTFDICGNAIPLDSLTEHCTINVTAIGANDHINVSWTPYIGAAVTSYGVYRMEIGNSTSVLVGTVPSNVLSIIDTNLYCPIDYSYRIRANNLNGMALGSNSDTSIATTQYSIIVNQHVDVVRSTVIDNSKVLTEWTTPAILPDKITGYALYRSTDNVNFTFLINVNSIVHDYIDTDVDVNQHNYYYKIVSENSCNVATLESNKSSSILLKADVSNGNVILNWTKYEGWDLGVDYYIIEKLDENGVWKTIKTVEGNQVIYEDK